MNSFGLYHLPQRYKRLNYENSDAQLQHLEINTANAKINNTMFQMIRFVLNGLYRKAEITLSTDLESLTLDYLIQNEHDVANVFIFAFGNRADIKKKMYYQLAWEMKVRWIYYRYLMTTIMYRTACKQIDMRFKCLKNITQIKRSFVIDSKYWLFEAHVKWRNDMQLVVGEWNLRVTWGEPRTWLRRTHSGYLVYTNPPHLLHSILPTSRYTNTRHAPNVVCIKCGKTNTFVRKCSCH